VVKSPKPNTRDRAAAACCAVTAAVESTEEGFFLFRGWLTLADLDLSRPATDLRPPGKLPEFLGVARRFAAAYLLGTLRLLAAGDPEPPASGLEGVFSYVPRRRFGRAGVGGPGMQR